LDLAVTAGSIKKNGAFYSYGDLRLGQGREAAKEFLYQHAETAGEIENILRSAVTAEKSASPPEDEPSDETAES